MKITIETADNKCVVIKIGKDNIRETQAAQKKNNIITKRQAEQILEKLRSPNNNGGIK